MIENLKKTEIGRYYDYIIYLVPGTQIRNEQDIDFTEGGNYKRYNYIPENEIWIDNTLPVSDIIPTMVHEYKECEAMKSGAVYDKAHELANTFEAKARKISITGTNYISIFKEIINNFVENCDDCDCEEIEVEAFSVGTHTSENGSTQTYTVSDLNEIAKTYNEKCHENPAPVVIGHPEMDAPAYGWIKKASVAGNKLLLKLGELNQDFVNALKTGAYKTRSIALYADGMIKHIGFLGAYKPAIKGLYPHSFKENNKPFFVFNFTEDDMPDDKTVVTDLEKRELAWYRKVMGWFKNTDIQTFTEPPAIKPTDIDPKEFAELKTAVNTVIEENTALKAKIAEFEAASKKKPPEDFKAFCEGLVKAGTMRPVDVDIEVANLKLRETADGVKQFAEGEQSDVDKYKEYLKKRQKIITYGETPNFPDKYAPVSVPTVDGMDAYVESKMEEKKKSDPKFKENYAEHLKAVYAEVSTAFPDIYAEYSKKFGCK